MSMAMAWTEQLNKGKRRTAVCKYSLRRPDIESLHSITEFAAGAQDSVQSLTCFAGKKNTQNEYRWCQCLCALNNNLFKFHSLLSFKETKLAALGTTTFSMWDHRSGDLLMKLDLDVPIGRNLGCFMLEVITYFKISSTHFNLLIKHWLTLSHFTERGLHLSNTIFQKDWRHR